MRNILYLSYFSLLVLIATGCSMNRNVPETYKLNPKSKSGLLIVRLLKSGNSASGVSQLWTATIEKKVDVGKKKITRKDKYREMFYFKEPNPPEDYLVLKLNKGVYGFGSVCAQRVSCSGSKEFMSFAIESGKALYMGELELILKERDGGWNMRSRTLAEFNGELIDKLLIKYPNLDKGKIFNQKSGKSYAEYSEKLK